MARESTFSVRASQGGRLINVRTPDNVGPGNYTEKINWRRLDDSEVPREGHTPFFPMTLLTNATTQSRPSASGDANVSDLVGAWEAVRPNGERALVVASRSALYRFDASAGTWTTIGSGFSTAATYWEGESLDGFLILNNGVDLPVTYRVESNAIVPLYELRESGVASVGSIAVANGFLLCSDITEIIPAELSGIMSGGSPYGLVPSNKVNRIRYKIAWSDFGEPRNWSPVITGTIQSATKNKVTLAFPMPHTFPVGTKLAVIGAGLNGGVLGGQEGYEEGVAVTGVSGAELTLNASADASLTYPLTVQVTRFADTSTFVGSATIKDDSSAVLRIRPLKQLVVVYRETGIWVGRYTGSTDTPFQFRPAYQGPNVPAYPRAIADIEGDFHVFVGESNFYRFDGAGNPEVFDVLDDASKTFFANAPTAPAKVFTSHNPVTREWWFHHANGVLAYDYVNNSASTIDVEYPAACSIYKPGTNQRWMLVASGNRVLQYAALETGPLGFRRDNGSAVTSVVCSLAHGEVTLNDDENEKDLKSYMPLFGVVTGAPATTEVRLYGRDNLSQTADQLCAVVLADPVGEPLVETFFRNVYFSDRVIHTPGVSTTQTRFTGSTFTFQGVRSQGVTRNTNGSG